LRHAISARRELTQKPGAMLECVVAFADGAVREVAAQRARHPPHLRMQRGSSGGNCTGKMDRHPSAPSKSGSTKPLSAAQAPGHWVRSSGRGIAPLQLQCGSRSRGRRSAGQIAECERPAIGLSMRRTMGANACRPLFASCHCFPGLSFLVDGRSVSGSYGLELRGAGYGRTVTTHLGGTKTINAAPYASAAIGPSNEEQV